MGTLSLTRDKIYRTVARQLHGVVPCWVCGEPVLPQDATLEHIKPLSQGGNSHAENLAISHGGCNHRRHIKTGAVITTDWWRATLLGDASARSRLAAPANLRAGDLWQQK